MSVRADPRAFSGPKAVLLKVRIGDADVKGAKEYNPKDKNPTGYVCLLQVLDKRNSIIKYFLMNKKLNRKY